jgi:hypothetical protein
MPVFDVATEDIYYKRHLLPSDAFRITYEDTQLSDAIGPQKMVDRYCSRTVDAVFGLAYVCTRFKEQLINTNFRSFLLLQSRE